MYPYDYNTMIWKHSVAICKHTVISKHSVPICKYTVICKHSVLICKHSVPIYKHTIWKHGATICKHSVPICKDQIIAIMVNEKHLWKLTPDFIMNDNTRQDKIYATWKVVRNTLQYGSSLKFIAEKSPSNEMPKGSFLL